MSTDQILTFHSGPYRLMGTLHLPDQRPAPAVIGCHGLVADRHSPKQIALAQACCSHGMAYFRFDHHGCGDSEGDFAAGASLDVRCRDVAGAVAALAEHPAVGPLIGLFGSSFGGTVVLAYAGGHPIPCLVTYAAPYTSTGLGTARATASLDPALTAALSETWDFDIRPCLTVQQNVLVIHAAGDAVVPVAHAHEIFHRARQPKQLIIQDGGDHPMSDPVLQTRFLSQAVQWFQGTFYCSCRP